MARSHAAITESIFSLTFPPLSVARCSFTSELGCRGEKKMSRLRNSSKGALNPGSCDCESGILPLSYHAPRRTPHLYSHNPSSQRNTHASLRLHICQDNSDHLPRSSFLFPERNYILVSCAFSLASIPDAIRDTRGQDYRNLEHGLVLNSQSVLRNDVTLYALA